MSFKWIVRTGAAIFLFVAIAFSWFLIASDYSDAAASGTYQLRFASLNSDLVLRPDHTFKQQIKDAHGIRYATGTWYRFGEAGIHFSPDFLTLPGQQGGEEDGSGYAHMERGFGIFIRLDLPTYEVVRYDRTDRSTGDQFGRYAKGGIHPRTLALNSDHTFEQHEVGWMKIADARGTWGVDHNGGLVLSREFLKPSGQPLAEYETATAMEPPGSPFLQIEIDDQKYKLSYHKKLPWQ